MDRLLKHLKEEQREEEAEAIPPVYVVFSEELTAVTEVPRDEVPKVWGILAKDLPLGFYNNHEYNLLLLKGKEIAVLSQLLVPDPDHPRIKLLLLKDLTHWINEENIDLLAIARTSRGKVGFERRMSTITATKWALRGW